MTSRNPALREVSRRPKPDMMRETHPDFRGISEAKQEPGPPVSEVVYSVGKATKMDLINLMHGPDDDNGGGARFALKSQVWKNGEPDNSHGMDYPAQTVAISNDWNLLTRISNLLSPTRPVEVQDHKPVQVCLLCSCPADSLRFPLVWGAYSENGNLVVGDPTIKETWWHKTDRHFPHKNNMTFCTAKNVPKSPTPVSPFKPKGLKLDRRMHEDRVVWHMKCVAGRLLTLMDATFGGNEKQNKAMISMVKKEFREQLSRISKEVWANPNEGEGCDSEQTREQKQVEELSLVD